MIGLLIKLSHLFLIVNVCVDGAPIPGNVCHFDFVAINLSRDISSLGIGEYN